MLKAGKIFKFDVNIKGEPPPTVTWLLVNKEVITEDNVEVINVEYNTKLNVIDAKRKNSGVYKIVAVNEHGKDEAEVEVVVLAAPSKPKGPLKVSDVTKSGCKLAWQPPEDDGGKPITFYKIFWDAGTGTNTFVASDPASVASTESPPQVTIRTNIVAGQFYKFKVLAVNEIGDGQLSP